MLPCKENHFGLPPDLHYLNCAYMAPLSNQVVEAGQRALGRLRDPSQLSAPDFFADGEAVRARFARLIGAADPHRIAIVPSVSYALAAVARNLPVDAGQNIVVLEEQFPSSVYTWRRRCQETGAELRTVPAPDPDAGRAPRWNRRVLDAIDRQTRVVALPELHWTDGTRFDLENIGDRARECGAALVVDGTQSVGAAPFDIQRIQPDALVCAGYKWLTGPYSLALAYLGPAFDDGVPLEENWMARRGSQDFARLVEYQDEYQPGALRYDVGERSNFILLPMLNAALSQVLEWTPSAIQEYCHALTHRAVTALRHLGCHVEDDEWRRSHLFGIRFPTGTDLSALAPALDAERVSVSRRGAALRIAPHLYNTEDDLDALVAAVRHVLPSSQENG